MTMMIGDAGREGTRSRGVRSRARCARMCSRARAVGDRSVVRKGAERMDDADADAGGSERRV